MKKPASYPTTDAPENRAVDILKYKLDVNRAKAYIKTRDKVPNFDGTIEVVDDNRIPMGKVDVQVKAIPEGATKYSCPISLVSYSKKTTLPFILVCVDTNLEIVYWKHISHIMPELKPDQDYFTIYFDATVDVIEDKNLLYLARWERLIIDYQERIEVYPTLKEEIETQQKLITIENKHLIWLQRYIDAINYVFDVQFSSLKTILMPGIRKLGLGIRGHGDSGISYIVHRIPYGDLTPLLVHLKNDQNEKRELGSQYRTKITNRGVAKSFMDESNPVKKGMRAALEVVQNAIKHNTYRIFGKTVSAEILFDFLDEHHYSFGLPYSDSYSVKMIAKGFYEYFPIWCSCVTKHMFSDQSQSRRIIDFDYLSNIIEQKDFKEIDTLVRDTLAEGKSISTFLISSARYKFQLFEDAIEYLLGNQIREIHRPYPIVGNYLKGRILKSESYNEDDLRQKIKVILEKSVHEYEEFLEGNRIKLLREGVTNPHNAVIYTYKIVSNEWSDFIEVEYYHFTVENWDKRFPKVVVTEEENIDMKNLWGASSQNDELSIIVNGVSAKVSRAINSRFSQLEDNTPMLSHIYSLLWVDFNENYGLDREFISEPDTENIPSSL